MLPLGTDSERDSERWGWGVGGGKAREGVREREGEGGGRSGLGGADSDSDSESSNPGMTVGLRLASGPGGRYSGSIRTGVTGESGVTVTAYPSPPAAA